MRKRLSIAILALFILGICTGLASAKDNGKSAEKGHGNKNKAEIKSAIKNYIDMENEWSREAVMEATVLGYVSGDEFSQFHPNQPLTKLEAIAMLLNAEGFQEDVDDYTLTEEEEKLLKKIPEWGKNYIAIALQEELILPDELQKFNPQQGIKRYEVCIYLSRIAGDTEVVPQTKQAFKDWAEIPEEYQAFVRVVHGKGLMNGNEEGKFCPNQIVKRCEMAVILGNLEDNILHRFESSKVKGTITDISEDGGVYTISVDKGSGSPVDVELDSDAQIFLDGQEIDLDDLSAAELADLVDRQVKLLVRDYKAVLVRITTDTEGEVDSKVVGTVEAIVIDEDDEDLPFTITVDTGDEEQNIEGDKDTKIYLNGKKTNIADINEDSVVDMQVTVTIENDKAVVIRLSEED